VTAPTLLPSTSRSAFRPYGVRPVMAVTLVLAGLLAGCDDGVDPNAGPGDLEVTLESPNGLEGAVLLEFRGGGIQGVTPGTGTLEYEQSGKRTQVMVILENPGTPSFVLSVADTLSPPRVEILEVAAPDNTLRSSLAGYDVRIGR
jgi:hypothetical protein